MVFSKQKCALEFILFALLTNLWRANGHFGNITNIYRDYLRNMIDYVDERVPPCDNFFLHACGNMNTHAAEEYESYGGRHRTPPFLYNRQDYYEFFETRKSEFSTQPGLLVRNLYELCKQTQSQKSGPHRMWLRMINDIPLLRTDQDLLHKWPFLQYQWETYEQQLDLSWPILAAELSAHGFEIFFNIFFAESTIYITPNKDFLCPEADEFKETLVPLLRQRSPQIANIIGGEMWQLCHQLKGELPLSQEANDVTDFLLDDTMTEFLQRFFPRLNLTDVDIEQARKIVVNVEILSEMMTVLKSTNSRIVYNYIMWHFYRQVSAVDDCFRLTDEFNSLLQVEYWHWNVFVGHFRREVALATYLFHTTRFQRFYRQIITGSSLDRMFQNPSQRKDLNIERSIRNFAKQFLNLENYSSIYQSSVFESANKTFYSSLLEMRRLALRYSFYNSYLDTEDMNFFQEFLNFCILLFYRPRFHYFASYDREMWRDSGLLHSSDDVYTAMDCLERQSRLNEDDYEELFHRLEVDQVNDVFDFYASFAKSMDDYKFWLESENFAMAEDYILEYFNLDSSRIMFYAVAQQLCSRNDQLYSSLINRSFMNTDDFQMAFECLEIDPMNPLQKCMMKP